MSRRLAAMLAAAGMAVAVLVVAGTALAVDPSPKSEDTTRPTVERITPANGATGVDRNANVKARFSEPMRAASVNGLTFELYRGNFTRAELNPDGSECTDAECPPEPRKLIVRVNYRAEKQLAVAEPTATLEANADYTALVEGRDDVDGYAVKDLAGNKLARDRIWHFETGAN